jgi:hypothetical protein
MAETVHDELLRISDELDRRELYGAAQAMVRGARRINELERALADLASHFETAINYIDDPSEPGNEFVGPTLIVLAGRNRLKAARAALQYRPAQMKGRER